MGGCEEDAEDGGGGAVDRVALEDGAGVRASGVEAEVLVAVELVGSVDGEARGGRQPDAKAATGDRVACDGGAGEGSGGVEAVSSVCDGVALTTARAAHLKALGAAEEDAVGGGEVAIDGVALEDGAGVGAVGVEAEVLVAVELVGSVDSEARGGRQPDTKAVTGDRVAGDGGAGEGSGGVEAVSSVCDGVALTNGGASHLKALRACEEDAVGGGGVATDGVALEDGAGVRAVGVEAEVFVARELVGSVDSEAGGGRQPDAEVVTGDRVACDCCSGQASCGVETVAGVGDGVALTNGGAAHLEVLRGA